MKLKDKYLIHCDQWFFAPDGNSYRAVWGTVHEIVDSKAALGVRTNAKSTNWYVVIGDMVIAGCQVHYAIRCDSVDFTPPTVELEHEGRFELNEAHIPRIYNADASGLIPVRHQDARPW